MAEGRGSKTLVQSRPKVAKSPFSVERKSAGKERDTSARKASGSGVMAAKEYRDRGRDATEEFPRCRTAQTALRQFSMTNDGFAMTDSAQRNARNFS